MSAEPILRISGDEGHRRDACATQSDPVGSWLRVLEPLLKLPESQRRAIVDELESHLRERVRDQMLAGVPEHEAVRGAIGELGDAAELARKFRAAGKTPVRRLAMHLALLGVAGAALVTSIVAVTRDGAGVHEAGFAIYQPEPAKLTAQSPPAKVKALSDIRLVDASMQDAIEAIAKAAELSPFARWTQLQEANLGKEERVDIAVKGGDLDRVFELLNEGRSGEPIDYRVHDGMLEVAPRNFFDKRETELVSFDISGVIGQGIKTDDLIEAIAGLVEQDGWRENGGETGMMTVVGNRLFVKAPPRMWKKAGWIIDQVAPGGGQVKPARGDGVPLLKDVPVLSFMFERRLGPDGMAAAREQELERLRLELVWAKIALGHELNDVERERMNKGEARSVKLIDRADPRYAQKEEELQRLLIQVETFEAVQTKVPPATLPTATR